MCVNTKELAELIQKTEKRMCLSIRHHPPRPMVTSFEAWSAQYQNELAEKAKSKLSEIEYEALKASMLRVHGLAPK
jgi:hypothetical protein